MQGNYVHKLTGSYATHEGQRTARRRSPGGSAAASAAPASPGARTIRSGHGLPHAGAWLLPIACTRTFLSAAAGADLDGLLRKPGEALLLTQTRRHHRVGGEARVCEA